MLKAKAERMPAGDYTVVVKFVVNPDGTLSNVKETGKKVGYGLDEAAVKFIQGSGRWIPANADGGKVKTAMTLPVNFTIMYSQEKL